MNLVSTLPEKNKLKKQTKEHHTSVTLYAALCNNDSEIILKREGNDFINYNFSIVMFVFIDNLCATFIFCLDIGFKVFYFYRYF